MDSDVQRLRIAIIGAGMSGLTAALALAKAGFQDIQIYENAPGLGFVGAGIQLAPNMAKVLDKLGVWGDVAKESVQIKKFSIRQGSTGEELGEVNMDHIKQNYGYAHMVGHRADLAGSIYAGCQKEKAVKFNMKSTLQSIESFGPTPSFTVLPAGGEPYRVECDVLLACDGIKSKARVAMLKTLNISADVEDTGQAAYRILLTRQQMQHDPELLALLDSNQVTRWIGPKRSMIGYPISKHSIYNISTAQPDQNFALAPTATYTTRDSKPAMVNTYADFCPLVHRMLALVPDGEVVEWKLRVHAPLPTWISGSVALAGDACHPTLPHLNQGAAQAVEDAAVLAVSLSRLPFPSPQSINKALRVYEAIRKTRAETLVALAAANGKAMQLGEGEAREERDKAFAALKLGKGAPSPDKSADAEVQKMINGFDCVQVAQDRFEELFRSM